MTRIAKVNDGHIIEALATLLHAANDLAPEDDPDRYDAWRAQVVAARTEYDALVRAARADRSPREPHGCPKCGGKVTPVGYDLGSPAREVIGECDACYSRWPLRIGQAEFLARASLDAQGSARDPSDGPTVKELGDSFVNRLRRVGAAARTVEVAERAIAEVIGMYLGIDPQVVSGDGDAATFCPHGRMLRPVLQPCDLCSLAPSGDGDAGAAAHHVVPPFCYLHAMGHDCPAHGLPAPVPAPGSATGGDPEPWRCAVGTLYCPGEDVTATGRCPHCGLGAPVGESEDATGGAK